MLVVNQTRCFAMTSLDGMTLEEIKRNIDTNMNMGSTTSCAICDDNENDKVSCCGCSQIWCVSCYIGIYRENKGLIKCPFCNFKVGEVVPDHLIDRGIMKIMDKLYG